MRRMYAYQGYAARKTTGYKLMYLIGITIGAGWSFMLAVGLVHHEWIRQCPTIGYFWAVLLAALVRAVFAGLMVTVHEDWT